MKIKTFLDIDENNNLVITTKDENCLKILSVNEDLKEIKEGVFCSGFIIFSKEEFADLFENILTKLELLEIEYELSEDLEAFSEENGIYFINSFQNQYE